MSDKTQDRSQKYGGGAVGFAQLSDKAKQKARDAWKAANPGKPNKTDYDIDQALTADGTQYSQDGEPV
jgi:hypothetical protein